MTDMILLKTYEVLLLFLASSTKYRSTLNETFIFQNTEHYHRISIERNGKFLMIQCSNNSSFELLEMPIIKNGFVC